MKKKTIFSILSIFLFSFFLKSPTIFGMENEQPDVFKQIETFNNQKTQPNTENYKTIFETLKKGDSRLKQVRKKIMVTHMHAKGTKSELSGFSGSKGIRKAVEKFKPDLLINSHIHEAEGLEDTIGKTKVVSVGKKGKIIEL